MTTEQMVNVYANLEAGALALLAPLTSEEAYGAALEAIDDIMRRMGQQTDHPLRPLFQLLLERVEAYEAAHFEIPEAPAHERLAYLLDTHELTQVQLAQQTGIPQSNISAVLRGTRQISKGMAKKLAQHFALPVETFLD